MPLHQPTRRRRIALVVVGALAVALTGSLGIARPWMPPAETAPIAAAPGGISPAALTLPDDPTVLVFGDSWTYGSAATPPTLGYAYLLADLLHGTTVVDGDLLTAAKELRANTEGTVLMHGFGPVASVLADAGLLDELHLWYHPVLAGVGDPDDLLLTHGVHAEFATTGTHAFTNGVVMISMSKRT